MEGAGGVMEMEMEAAAANSKFEYTPTWIIAVVCSIIVLLSFCAERGLHRLGKLLQRKRQDALYEALQKLKEELMLLGFISLLLSVVQGAISHICMPPNLANYMLPCKRSSSKSPPPPYDSYHYNYYSNTHSNAHVIGRHLLSSQNDAGHCLRKGKLPLLSLEALHQLHIFIFVLAVVHVIFCASTMLLAAAQIRKWKVWEDSIKHGISPSKREKLDACHKEVFVREHVQGYWRRAAVISWMMGFAKQFHGSITKSDYISLRRGFIKEHCPGNTGFDFYSYTMRTLQNDFNQVVGISWYLWVFVVLFLLLNLEGWHTYFWLSFLPLILLLLVGAKLEHIITRLAQESDWREEEEEEDKKKKKKSVHEVKPSDQHFWFSNPTLVLHLIHFILFQNSFEIGFFFWIWTTYGFKSCIMEKPGFIITRLFMGVIVQVLCSYSTLPLYALVTQMGSTFKKGIFEKPVEEAVLAWAEHAKNKTNNTANAAAAIAVVARSLIHEIGESSSSSASSQTTLEIGEESSAASLSTTVTVTNHPSLSPPQNL